MKKKLALLLMIAMTLGQTPGYAFADETAGNDSEAVAGETTEAVTEEGEAADEAVTEAAVTEVEAETAETKVETEPAAAEEETKAAAAEEETEAAAAEAEIEASATDETDTTVTEGVIATAPVVEDSVTAQMSINEDDGEDDETYEVIFNIDTGINYYRDGEYTFSPDNIETSGRDYKLVYTVSTWDEGGEDWVEISNSENEFSVSGDEITIHGENFAGEEDLRLRIDVTATDAASGETLDSDFDYLTLKQPLVKVDESFSSEEALHTYFSVPETISLYVENAQQPYGDYISCPRTKVVIESQSPKTPGETVVELGEDFDEWGSIYASGLGTAVLRIYYTDPDGEEQSYTRDVSVVEKIYDVCISCSKYSIVPGETIALSSSLNIRPEDEEDDSSTDALEYRWSVDEDVMPFADLSVDETDPSHAELTIGTDFDCSEMESFKVCVEVGTTKNGTYEKLTDDSCWIDISEMNYELHILQHNESLLPGDSEEIRVEVRQYSAALAGGYEVLDNVTFSWDDVEDIDIAQGSTADTFTVTRNQAVSSSATLRAEWTEANPADPEMPKDYYLSQWIYFDEMNYLLDHNDDQHTFYSDGTYAVGWYCVDRDDLDVSYQYKVGEEDWDSDDGFGTIYSEDCYSADGSTITLDGPKLAAEGAKNIRIEAQGVHNGVTLARGSMTLELTEAEEEYSVDLMNVLDIGNDWWIGVDYSVWNTEYPGGDWGSCKITNVRVISQQTDDGADADVVSLNKENDEDGEISWNIKGLHMGAAEVSVSFLDLSGQERTETKKIFVAPFYGNFILCSENNENRTLPGGQISLYVKYRPESDDIQTTAADFVYQWGFDTEVDTSESVTLTADAADPSRAVVTFKAFPDDWWEDYYGVIVKVSVGKMICGEYVELGSDYITLSEVNDYYDVIISGHNPALELGKSETVNVQLRHYSTEFDNGYEVIPDAEFSWIDAEDYLKIEENSTGSFNIRRMAGYETIFDVEASWEEAGEEKTASHRIGFDELGYVLRFKDYGYDDEFDAVLVPNDQDLVLEYTTAKIEDHPEITIKASVGRYRYNEELDDTEFIPFTEGKDYDVKGQKIILHGASLRKIAKGYFFGKVSASYEGYEITGDQIWCHVDPMPVDKLNISVDSAVYTGKEVTPKVTVKDGGTVLEKDADYEVTFSNNIKVGTATATITGLDNYKGAVDKTFAILFAKPAVSSVSNVADGVKIAWGKVNGAAKYRVFRKAYNPSTKTWSGWGKVVDTTALDCTDKGVKSGIKYAYTVRCITADGKTYTSGYDNTGKAITYVAAPVIKSIANVNGGVKIVWPKTAGAASYRVFRKTGRGGWTGVGDTTSVSFVDKKAGNGKTYSYTVRCMDSAKKFVSAYDTKGKTITYVACPRISSLTSPKTKQMLAKWGRNTSSTGYQIQYSTNRKFASGNRTVTVRGANNVSRTISRLTSKKRYYVRIRTFKTVGKKNYYSAWSAVKNVVIK